jgi:8-oxo-dGTP pyrophosphatase MutT (NUDIX family)
MKGYKILDSELKCNGHQFHLTYENVCHDNNLFDYCLRPVDCLKYGNYNIHSRFAVVEGSDIEVKGDRVWCKRLKILYILSHEQFNRLLSVNPTITQRPVYSPDFSVDKEWMGGSSRVGVILRCGERYLCVYQHASKLWGFPKGQLDPLESNREGASRELFEETGIQIDPHILNPRNVIYTRRGKNSHCYYIVDVKVPPPVNIDNYEISDYRWMTLEEILHQPVSFFTRRTVERLQHIKLNNNYIQCA